MTDKKQLLLVEDDMFSAETLKYALEAKGHEVIMATNGSDALSIVRKKNPQLVVLDIMMPKMDGYHLCRFIKFDTRYKHIPVIFVSSKIQEADKKLGFTCGGDEYVTKPYDIDHLVNLVDRYLESIQRDAMLASNAEGTSQGGIPPTPNQGNASQGGTPPTPNQGNASQGGTTPTPTPTLTPNQGDTSHGGTPPMPNQGNASYGGTPPTSNQGDTSHGGTPPMPNQGNASHGGTPPTPNQGNASHGGTLPTPNQGDVSQGSIPPEPNQGETSQGVKIQTMMTGETFVIRDNAKITVLNIDSEKVQLSFNDSGPVTIHVHECKTVNEDISIKVITTDMDLVELEITVSDKTERSKKWFF